MITVVAVYSSTMSTSLVYSNIANWDFHHAQLIEIAWDLYAQGKRIILLECESSLSSCAANPQHKLKRCATCILQSDFSSQHYPPGTIRLKLNLSKYRQVKIVKSVASQRDFEGLEFQGMPVGKLTLSQLTDDSSDIHIPLEILNREGLNHVANGIALYLSTLDILEKYLVDEVYVWNGRRISDGPLLFAAREFGAKAFCFISGSNPKKYFLQANSLHSTAEWKKSIENFYSDPDFALQVDAEAKEYFHEFRYGKSPTLGYEWFAKDFKADTSSRSSNSSSKKNLVVFTSALWEVTNYLERDSLSEDFLDTYKLISRFCSDSEVLEKFNVIVRWHPNLTRAGEIERNLIREVIQETPSVFHFDPESDTDSYQLLDKADIVLTTGSSMGIEASYAGKVSILAGLAFYSGFGVYEPADFIELKQLLLRMNLKPFPKSYAEKFGCFMRNFGSEYKYIQWAPDESMYLLGDQELSFRSQRHKMEHIASFGRNFLRATFRKTKPKFLDSARFLKGMT